MLTASFVTTALVIALVVGGACSIWLWTVRFKQLVITGGLWALAGMRWREFSRFVIEALQAQGFEASRIDSATEPGQHADLLLNRDDQTWLLSCKQGVNYRIDTSMVDELALSVRARRASGGILVTLGRIEPEARKRDRGIELLDGAGLWPLIDPLLPPSLHQELVARARAQTRRATVLAWVVALVLGVTLAMLLPRASDPDATAAVAAPAARVPPATSATTATPPEPAPLLSEDEQRVEIERSVSTLPGLGYASWVTRSTLLVHLMPGTTEPQIDAICTVLERSDALGASRVQLQPPAGSGDPVRFMQCRTF